MLKKDGQTHEHNSVYKVSEKQQNGEGSARNTQNQNRAPPDSENVIDRPKNQNENPSENVIERDENQAKNLLENTNIPRVSNCVNTPAETKSQRKRRAKKKMKENQKNEQIIAAEDQNNLQADKAANDELLATVTGPL